MGINGVFTPDQINWLDKLDQNRANEQKKQAQVLDKDAFLKLMLTQLQHQNPLEPMDNTEFIAQMAQFSSVEQLANISTSMENMHMMTALISAQLDEMNKGEDGKHFEKLFEQNQKVLEEMIKLNETLNAYVGKNSSDKNQVDEDLMALVSHD